LLGILFYVLTPHVLSEWMVEVCGKYLCIGLAFELVDVIDIRCYIVYNYYIIYYTIILYIILYSSLLLFFSYPFPIFLNHLPSFPPSSDLFLPNPLILSSSLLFPPQSFYTCRYLHILIYIILPSQPFYTCRYLDTHIYIQSFLSQSSIPIPINNSTPHVLSEWMVEV
jgi:hypothetical protein